MDPLDQGAGYMDPEFRWHLNGYGQKEYPHPHPQDIRDVIQRELEKERIREEIIMSEIVRRRVLEAEMRRVVMMEREMALQQGSDWFPFGSSPVMGLESPMRPSLLVTKAEGWSAEERRGMALEDKEKRKRSENGALETLPFQRVTTDLRISEVKPASESHKEKERIVLLNKTDENASGLKTKDVTPPEVVNIELLADDVIANKISKEEWGCALCQVMATSEKHLNAHVLGKKHKSKVAALRAQGTGKNYKIGLFPKEATKPIQVKEKGLKLKAQSLFSEKAGEATSKKDDLPLSKNPKSKPLKKTQAEVNRKVQKNEDDPRKKVKKNEKVMNAHKLRNTELPADVIKNKKWSCALCQVIATRENDLIEHVLGKKHESKVAALKAQRTGKNYSIPKKAAESIHVGEEEVKLKAQSLFSEKAGEATSKQDDLPLSENPKSKHIQNNEDDPRKKVEKNEKVMNADKFGNTELPADVIKNKKWSCALCQVIVTRENDLIEHVLGKKHESKVVALKAQRTGKNHSIPKKAAESIHVGEFEVKLKAQSLFSEKAGEATSKKDDSPLSENPKSKHLKKTQAEVNRNVQNNEDDPRKKVEKNEKVMDAHKLGNTELPADVIKNKKWSCALCQVIVTSENDLIEHVLGKKHESKVVALKAQRTGKNYSIPKKAAESIHVGEEEVKLKAQSLFSEKAGEATSKKDDLPLLGNPKSEHLKKTQSEVIRKVQKNEDDPRKKVEKNENDPRKKGCMFSEVMNAHKLENIELPADVTANKKSEWKCALCQVCATSEKGLNEHVLGKKHKSKEAALRISED